MQMSRVAFRLRLRPASRSTTPRARTCARGCWPVQEVGVSKYFIFRKELEFFVGKVTR
jgi:hypothetical protein